MDEQKKDLARCRFCGHEGEYGVEIIETGYCDPPGYDSTVCACKDIDACNKRTQNE